MAEGTRNLRTGWVSNKQSVSIKTEVCMCQACTVRRVTSLHASCIPEILQC